jgi:COMPASS component SWD3
MKHFHTTSGKELNKIQEPLTSFITCEYRPDGCAFLTAAYDGIIRTYDEQTRQLVTNLTGGGTGLPGHQSRVVCAKYVPDDPNIIVSGGWDGQICIWDVRAAACQKKIVGLNICGDSIDIHDGFILAG